MTPSWQIRPAQPHDNWILTRVTYRSKGHWQYPPEYFLRWKDELTITPEYIRNNVVFVMVIEERVVGYYSLVQVPVDRWYKGFMVTKGCWLEHLFVLPEFMGKGLGGELMSHALNTAKERGQSTLRLVSDPHARGFYEKKGGRFLYDTPSSIPGRKVPVYELIL